MNESKEVVFEKDIIAPIDFPEQNNYPNIYMMPYGWKLAPGSFESLLRKSSISESTIGILDTWFASADKSGLIWVGANATTDRALEIALDKVGRTSLYAKALRMRILFSQKRKIRAIEVPWQAKWITEEAAYRVLSIFPNEAKHESIKIVGLGTEKYLGEGRYTTFEYDQPEKIHW